MRKIDPFQYVNGYYGLDLRKGRPVVSTYRGGRREGVVWKADGQYIHIMFHDTGKVEGPHHPTSDLEYPAEAK